MKKLGFLWIGLVGCNIGNEPVYDQLPVMESALPEKRTAAVVPSRGVSHVNWPLALEAERLPRDVLVPEELDLPVLLLDAPVAMFISEEHWYTASYRFSDHNVVIEGTRIVFSDSVPEGTSTPLRDAPRVATTHHIVDATFVDCGVSYTVSMECRKPSTNPKCADGQAVLTLVDELLLADSPAALREAQ